MTIRFSTYLHPLVPLVALASLAAADYPVERWNEWSKDSTIRYPADAWQRYAAAEEAGWCSSKLADARAYFDELNSAAVLVAHDGVVLAAWGDVDRRFMCHSIRKSLLSGLYGVHVAEGNIDLNETLAELGIDDEPALSDSEKRARVIDLLTSRSGVYHSAAYETDKMKENRPARDSRRPGEIFWYNNWDFNALSTILQRQSGVDLFEDFQRRFAEPLAMQDFRVRDGYYHLEAHHSIHPAYPFRMSARDMARFGLLYLRGGEWNGRRVLSEDWIARSTSSTFRAADAEYKSRYAYGYLWWPVAEGPLAELGMVSARGYGGHSIDVLPGAELVVVHRVNTFWDLGGLFDRERKSVSDSQRVKLIEMLLDARVSRPKPQPRLEALEDDKASGGAVVVSVDPSQLDRYVGRYEVEGLSLSVRRADDDLLLEGPSIGTFRLLPLSETRFLMEDVEAPVTFDRDADGQSVRMSIEVAPGETRAASRSAS